MIRHRRKINILGLILVVVSMAPAEGALTEGLSPSSGVIPMAGPASERFSLVFNGEGVKDNLTGLIWEQSPDSSYVVWSEAISHCLSKTLGGVESGVLPL